MALTMVEAAKLTQDMLLRGVIETIVSESQVLNYLPFMDVVGNALTYNQENVLGNAGFYAVGDTWLESTPTFTQKTAKLSILGGDADVDNFLQQTYSNTDDLAAAVVASKAKSTGRTFTDRFFNGDSVADPKGFDGLHLLIPAGQRVSMGVNGGSLTLDALDQAIDLVKPGKPDAMFLSKRTRRKLKQLRRGAANVMEVDIDQFGRRIEHYDGIPVIADDFILDSRSAGTGTNLSTIYLTQFGYQRGLMGLHNGGVQVDEFGKLETKDATRRRIKWYASLALFRDIACAAVDNITAA